jgi:hypothetical protein
MFTLFGAFFLEGRRGAQCGIESQVVSFPMRWARLDIPPALALSMCAGAPAAITACDPVERILDFARQESGPDFYFFAAVPPVGGNLVEDILPGWFARSLPGFLIRDFSGYGFFFFCCFFLRQG